MTELVYGKRNNLSHIFYSGRWSLFARLIACIRANPELIHQFNELDILILFIWTKNLTELSYFPLEMKDVLKPFHHNPIFVKFHTIPLEKDEVTSTHYPTISLIQVKYISENFKFNIEATRKFEPGLSIKEPVEPLQSNAKVNNSILQDYEVFTANPTLLS